MKRLFNVLVALVVAFCLVSCKQEPEQIAFSVSASTLDGSKTDFINPKDGTGKMIVFWSPGDKLFVFGEEAGYLGYLDLLMGDGTHDAIFEGKIDPFETQTLHFYYFGTEPPTVASGTTSLEFDFTNQESGKLVDVAKKHIAYAKKDNVPAGTIQVQGLVMRSLISLVRFDLVGFGGYVTMHGDGTPVYRKMTLNLQTGQYGTFTRSDIATSDNPFNLGRAALQGYKDYSTYMIMVPSDMDNPSPLKFKFRGAGNGKEYTLQHSGLEANKFYGIIGNEVTMPPVGALRGKFSISDTKQVWFSTGNLWYRAKDGKWAFAEHQWDYIGNAAGNTTVNGRDSQSAWIDLFGRGTSGSSSRNKPYTTNYSTNDNLRNSNYDWGYYLTKNGGTGIYTAPNSTEKIEGQWYVLNRDELRYLEGSRQNNEKYNTLGRRLYGVGTLLLSNGERVEGAFIMPDNFYSPYPYGPNNEGFYGWEMREDVLTYVGGIFFPFSRMRVETTVYGQYGGYNYNDFAMLHCATPSVLWYHTKDRTYSEGSGSWPANRGWAVRLMSDVKVASGR